LYEEARDNPDLLVGHLIDYHTRHHLSQDELAEYLGCAVERIWEGARTPIPQNETLETDIEKMSQETGCSVAGLRRVIDEQKRPPLVWVTKGGES
jgi:AraC-like DNA-binding protein